MTGNGVAAQHVGGVLHLRLDAARRRNALTRSMLRALGDALTGFDAATTGVLLSGGEDCFSAGADFRELTGTSADIAYDDAVAAVVTAIRGAPRVVVAAVEGPCLGAAADIALACDMRIAGAESYLQIPAARLGLLYNPSAVDRLRRSLPPDSVRRLLLLGERFTAEEAVQAGLFTQVVGGGEAIGHAVGLLTEISPEDLDAIAATRALLNTFDEGEGERGAWERKRRALLDSPARHSAIAKAKQRHATTEESRSTE
jgi:enoyl-CoA hydratase/carnithine racemase